LIIHVAKPGRAEPRVVYCDDVKNIQGILPLNGRVFVVGAGPQGTGCIAFPKPERRPCWPPRAIRNPTPLDPIPARATPAAPSQPPRATTPAAANRRAATSNPTESPFRRHISPENTQTARRDPDFAVSPASAMSEASDLDPTSIAGANELKPVSDLPAEQTPKPRNHTTERGSFVRSRSIWC